MALFFVRDGKIIHLALKTMPYAYSIMLAGQIYTHIGIMQILFPSTCIRRVEIFEYYTIICFQSSKPWNKHGLSMLRDSPFRETLLRKIIVTMPDRVLHLICEIIITDCFNIQGYFFHKKLLIFTKQLVVVQLLFCCASAASAFANVQI